MMSSSPAAGNEGTDAIIPVCGKAYGREGVVDSHLIFKEIHFRKVVADGGTKGLAIYQIEVPHAPGHVPTPPAGIGEFPVPSTAGDISHCLAKPQRQLMAPGFILDTWIPSRWNCEDRRATIKIRQHTGPHVSASQGKVTDAARQ